MGWSRRAIVGGAVAVVLGGVVVAVVAHNSGPDAPAAPARAVLHTGTDAAEQSNVDAVTKLLTGLPAAFAAGHRDGLAPSSAGKFADVRKALPPGSKVDVHPETWRRAGTTGTIGVTITVPKSPPQSFIVVLTQEASGWKVISTQAAAGPS
ncbi:MAG: hypothetical protein V7637_2349 [Mycobacteriales bacterium]|jgi:hypothetical protein